MRRANRDTQPAVATFSNDYGRAGINNASRKRHRVNKIPGTRLATFVAPYAKRNELLLNHSSRRPAELDVVRFQITNQTAVDDYADAISYDSKKRSAGDK